MASTIPPTDPDQDANIGRDVAPLMKQYAKYSQIGLEFAAPAILGAVLDYFLGWSPVLTVIGAVVGLVGGTIHLMAIAKKMEQE